MLNNLFHLPERMRGTEPSAQGQNDINVQRAFWIAIILTVVAFASVVLTIFVISLFPVWQVILMSAIAAMSLISDVISVVLIRRGQAALGVRILYWSILFTLPLNVLLLTGITAVLAGVLLTMGFVVVFLLFPPAWKKYLKFGPIVSVAVMILIDLIRPSFRFDIGLSPTTSYYGEIVLGFLILSIIVLLVRQTIAGNIRTKLLVAFIGVTLLAMIILGVVSNQTTRTQIISDVGTVLQTNADAQGRTAGDFLANQVDRLTAFGRQRDVLADANAAYTGSAAAIQSELERLDQQWRTADQAGNDADPLVAARLNNATASALREYRQTFPENVEVFLTDRYGALVATTNRTSDYYQADEAWWQTAYNNGGGKVYIGEMEYDESSQIYAIIIAIPIYAENSGRAIGVFRTTVSMESLIDLIASSLQELEGAHTDMLFPSGRALAEGNLEEMSSQDQTALRAAARPYVEFAFEGVPSFVSVSPIQSNNPNVADLGWLIITHQARQTALAPVDAQLRTLVFVGLAIASLVVAIAFIFARVLTSPILQLTKTAQKVASGDLMAEASVTTGDEVGQLATTFNSMTRQLRNLIGTLEQRVAERTQSLELAAEVGRSISQVRALDIMLKDAAELIRSRFDLYYVQVYLTDPSQTNLILQSGTGAVGAELIGRGHRLPLNTASINGRAAIEKRSVVVADTAVSATFRPNPLLPDTRSEMAVPLLIDDRVVGVLDMQSEHAGSLNQEGLPAFEALAGQLAITIQNATFLAETQRAHAEVEAQARRLTRANWVDYLDAIHQPEQIGFMFQGNQVTSLAEAEQPDLVSGGDMLTAPISVSGEKLGTLVVEMEEQKRSSQMEQLTFAVARQVARQIESLRLLDSAERYRAEAEQASRRLTREGWQDYTDANAAKGISYLYDLKEVRPVNQVGDQPAEESAFNLPLKARDETVGRLIVQGLGADDKDALELANAVAERLGAHIESLRQQDQTQSALAQTEKLSVASLRFARSADPQELLAVASETLNIPVVNRALLGVFNYSSDYELESMDIVANWWNGSGHEPSEIGRRYSKQTLNVLPLFMSTIPVFSNDTFHDERVNKVTLELVTRQNIRSMAVLPLFLGARQLGVLILEAEETHIFSPADVRLFVAMAPQIATVLENRRQFERAQKQAERESTLNLISQKIQSATTVEAVLQIAARELGHALGAPMTIAQLSMKDKK